MVVAEEMGMTTILTYRKADGFLCFLGRPHFGSILAIMLLAAPTMLGGLIRGIIAVRFEECIIQLHNAIKFVLVIS